MSGYRLALPLEEEILPGGAIEPQVSPEGRPVKITVRLQFSRFQGVSVSFFPVTEGILLES